ncbi:MAG: hypothetical protein WBO16_15965 [Gammaproteobacteria bacterium]|jgi:predicted Holliday junction resolvase-like endonuclease
MKQSVIILFLSLPTIAFSQNFTSMNEADMEEMVQEIEKKMESCLENVDEEKLKEFEKRTQAIEEEVNALCASGKRDEAEKKAASLGSEIAKDPMMQQISKCNEMMQSMMSKMDYNMKDTPVDDRHVCD